MAWTKYAEDIQKIKDERINWGHSFGHILKSKKDKTKPMNSKSAKTQPMDSKSAKTQPVDSKSAKTQPVDSKSAKNTLTKPTQAVYNMSSKNSMVACISEDSLVAPILFTFHHSKKEYLFLKNSFKLGSEKKYVHLVIVKRRKRKNCHSYNGTVIPSIKACYGKYMRLKPEYRADKSAPIYPLVSELLQITDKHLKQDGFVFFQKPCPFSEQYWGNKFINFIAIGVYVGNMSPIEGRE